MSSVLRPRRRALWQLQGGLCFYCGNSLGSDGCDPSFVPTVDEVVPRAKGGRRAADNVVLAHLRCNALKANRMPTPDELARLEELLSRDHARNERLVRLRDEIREDLDDDWD